MFCQKCGKKVSDGTKFCQNCGEQINQLDVFNNIDNSSSDSFVDNTKVNNNEPLPSNTPFEPSNSSNTKQNTQSKKQGIPAGARNVLVGVVAVILFFVFFYNPAPNFKNIYL